jgi:hypothetical protein
MAAITRSGHSLATRLESFLSLRFQVDAFVSICSRKAACPPAGRAAIGYVSMSSSNANSSWPGTGNATMVGMPMASPSATEIAGLVKTASTAPK